MMVQMRRTVMKPVLRRSNVDPADVRAVPLPLGPVVERVARVRAVRRVLPRLPIDRRGMLKQEKH
jgi:hypothetical protein